MRIGTCFRSCPRWVPVVTVFVALLAAGAAQALTFNLLDHGDGQLGPDYGLRYDLLPPDPPDGEGPTFSFENGVASVLLTWDVVGGTAVIDGQILHNSTSDLWDLTFTIENITPSGGGFVSPTGSGTLTDPLDNVHVLLSEQNGDGDAFIFRPDGHRLDGDNSTWVGRGWLLPPGSTDDFLFAAAPIPEPGAAILYATGLLVVGSSIARRRR